MRVTNGSPSFARSLICLSLGGLVATPAAVGAEGVARSQVVDRAIEVHGGDLYERSAVSLRMCSGSGCYDVRAQVDGGLYEYDVTGPTRAGERRVRATNDELEAWLDGEAVAVEPDQVQGLRDWATARLYFCFLPYRLNDESVFKEELGLESWQGRKLRKVKVTFQAGSSSAADDEYLYWFDPESGRLEQFAYSYRGDPGGLRFRRLENYRRVGGILFFDQQNLGSEGPGLRVDVVTPEYVERAMRPVSTVRLGDVEVRPLD